MNSTQNVVISKKHVCNVDFRNSKVAIEEITDPKDKVVQRSVRDALNGDEIQADLKCLKTIMGVVCK